MELRTMDGQLKAGAAFRLVATGYIIGASLIFGPLFLLATLTMGVQRPAPASRLGRDHGRLR